MFDEYVQDPLALERMCKRMRDAPWIAVDTEFVRERTYHAKLGLIQLANASHVIGVDPLAVSSLDPLIDVLYAANVLKILHAARQDLEIFYDLHGSVPAPVFDTQIAAALAGFPEQISYAALVASVLGVELEKHHTRTDWAKRPLSDAQLRYAEEDVRYLRDLQHVLAERLAALGRSSWLTQECARLTHSELYRNDPENAHARIKHGHTLTPAGQHVLRALAHWREATAQQQNLPRNWVLRDAVLFELAQRLPKSPAELKRIKGLGARSIRKWGTAIIETISTAGLSAPAEPLWAPPKPLDAQQAALCERMLKLLRVRAREQGLSPTLIASRRDIQALVRGDTSGPLLSGWRQQLVGEDLLAIGKA
ncbi:MAG: ribonuclease D [Acidiferrobacterales bacterium]